MIENLNNGESKLSFRTKLNNMFTEIYNYLANLVKKSTDLSDMPNADALNLGQGFFLKVNDEGNAYELVVPSTFNLSDMPTARTGLAGYYLKVNSDANAYILEKSKFIGALDTPASFTGSANKILIVNASGTAVTFASLGLTVTRTWSDNASHIHEQEYRNGILTRWTVDGA